MGDRESGQPFSGSVKFQLRTRTRWPGAANTQWRVIREDAGKIRSIILSLDGHIKEFGLNLRVIGSS